ncbi:Zn-ribbon domain-containing OB-fold protein [Rhodococcus sp. NCIMB 12038]|uniref:Zn-ribbon domain-containing OB-fold protein n=1 Tax=Rhodococcus sp. NCIMB 12038 TaxID=933800 RepID=UPI000B3C79E7|nr:OB-fold domain-containing protein [Rhodococcus sp. NCIMB 12038]OUS88577.1 hypothetical protein CA951_38065 [Rhodococcus sp. NCIMB 12038]
MTTSNTSYAKPLPDTDGLHGTFWEGARRGELLLQQCRECGTKWNQGSGFCPGCLAADFDWVPAAGTGTIYARIFMHQVYWPSFKDDVPYNVVWVKLDEGPLMTANVVEASKEDIEIGKRVEVVFESATPEITIPRFRLA